MACSGSAGGNVVAMGDGSRRHGDASSRHSDLEYRNRKKMAGAEILGLSVRQ